MILERVTGRTISDYMSEKIWSLIGAEYPASWCLDSKRSGFEHMESGFNACAIDFAKFGRLFLNNGRWEGKEVLPESWVIESTSPDPLDKRPWKNNQEWEQEGGYYKYHWWGIRNKDGSYDYAALGHLGQVIYIRPRDKSMALRFGMKGSSREWAYIMRAILDQAEK
jgi:CubicO group peptidase (beta-lactamase class C family)